MGLVLSSSTLKPKGLNSIYNYIYNMIRDKKRAYWITKFEVMLKKYHRKNINKIAIKLTQRGYTARYSMAQRSRKKGVRCTITVEQIRQLLFYHYHKKCKYEKDRVLDYKNMVFDHRIPISKGGESTLENIQVISRFANNVKGSLTENQLYTLLRWLKKIEPELAKNIKVRLAKGRM